MAQEHEPQVKLPFKIVQIMGWLALAIYLLVGQFIKGQYASKEIDLVAIAQSNVSRITRLEAIVERLGPVPDRVSEQGISLMYIKEAVDRIEKKVDLHIREVK